MEPKPQYICPITLAPIVDLGMVCTGNIYEYGAIIEWLKNSCVDPLTGLPMATTFVRKVDVNDGDIESLVADAKKSYSIWYPQELSWICAEKEYNELSQLKNSFDFNLSAWTKYNVMKRGRFTEGNSLAYVAVCKSDVKLVDAGDSVKRPANTGMQYDFIDLNSLLIKKAQFKFQTFRFTNFLNCMFISCSLPRVRFIGCDLDGVQFVKCTFIGEEVCFYKVKGKFSFCGCSMEYVNKWKTTDDLGEIVYILKSRGLLNAGIEIVGDRVMVSV